MVYAIVFVVLVLLVVVLIKLTSEPDRYAKMTEEEFEAEAKRVSMLGVGMAELQKHVDPQHRVEYILRRDKHVEADSAESGGRPPEKAAKSARSSLAAAAAPPQR